MVKKMKSMIVLLSVFFILISCSDESLTNCNYNIGEIMEVTIPDTVIVNKVYEVEIEYSLPNICYSFKKIETEIDNKNLNIDILACKNSDGDCPQALVYRTVKKEIVFSEMGTFNISLEYNPNYKKVLVIE